MVMHSFNIIIIMSIASSIGWIAAIYVDNNVRLAIGYFVASVIGAFTASYMTLWFMPQYGNTGIILAALTGSVSLVAGWGVWHRKPV